jgi:hypothetical protein
MMGCIVLSVQRFLFRRARGYFAAEDLHAHIVQQAQEDLDQALGPELEGIAVTMST